jgi:biotin transporter BioY
MTIGTIDHTPTTDHEDTTHDVVITGVDLSIGELCMLLVKISIAFVPAAIIVAVFWVFLAAFLGGFAAMLR